MKKSVRLNKGDKELLVSHILNKAFGERREALKNRKKALGDSCYMERYTAKEREAMKTFPNRKAFNHSDSIPCHFYGRYVRLDMTKARPFFYEDSPSRCKFMEDHPLSVRWTAIRDEEISLKEDEKKLEREIWSILVDKNTSKQLLEAWPQCEPFLIAVGIFDEPAPVPMKNPETLNKMLCDLIGPQSPTCEEKK